MSESTHFVRPPVHHLSAFFVFILITFLLSASASAEEGQSGTPPLPAPNDEQPLYITSKNVALFHELLIAPLAAWLKEGRFVARAVRALEQEWEISPEWRKSSHENAEKVDLSANGDLILKGDALPTTGVPFGDALDINREADPEKRAKKILWNALYAQFPVPNLFYGTEFALLSPQGVARRTSGLFFRRFYRQPYQQPVPLLRTAAPPPAKGSTTAVTTTTQSTTTTPAGNQPLTFSGPGDLVLQDVLQLVSPPVVFGLANVTWRYRGAEDDRVWDFSPVIERARQVFGSNRGDPILEGFFAPDDLFVWSMKIQSVRARVVDEKELLVPFVSLVPTPLQDESLTAAAAGAETAGASSASTEKSAEIVPTARGMQTRPNGSAAFVAWNYETSQYPASAAWVPTSITFVPRRVWVLEILPQDPFYQSGRQILIVDQQMMLPVYKVTYDVRGVYARTIIGGWGLAASEKQELRFPFLGFQLAVERGSSRATALSTQFVRTFGGKDTPGARTIARLLDISTHGPKPVPAEEKVEETPADTAAPPKAPKKPAAKKAEPEPEPDAAEAEEEAID